MTAPAPTVCAVCEGEGTLLVLDLGRTTSTSTEQPCPACSCLICGQPTNTPPVCLRCDVVEERAAQRRSDR